MPASQASNDSASATIYCVTLTATGTGVDGFTPDGALTSGLYKGCRRVFLSAPTADTNGAKVNTSAVVFGTAGAQGDWIATDGSRDRYINIDDPSKLHFKFGTVGDKLEVRIEM